MSAIPDATTRSIAVESTIMVKKSVADNSDDRVNLGRDIATPVVKAEESTSLKEEAPKKKRVSMVEENIQPTKR